jgi:hypothetical protein
MEVSIKEKEVEKGPLLEGSDRRKSPMGEEEPLAGGCVAVPQAADPGVDPLEWEDARDSLVDPEGIAPGVEPVLHGPRLDVDPVRACASMQKIWSPSASAGSGAGPSSGTPPRSLIAASVGSGTPQTQEEEYVRISISGGPSGGAELARPNTIVHAPSQDVSFSSGSADASGSVCSSYTGPNSQMQLVPRKLACQLEREENIQANIDTVDAGREDMETSYEHELRELARVKSFCSSILKTLAPPLLQEVEKATGLRADAEPFTPKRVTRRSTAALAGT